jgi:hypothetical protein
MNERELLENWGAQKQSQNFRRLNSSAIAEYELVGQRGHPSSYAFVKFFAEPADELSLIFEVEWPAEFDQTYTKRIKHTIAEAVLDTLWLVKDPFRGCLLRLVEFKWDPIGGSEVAVHSATLVAMHMLVADGDWVLVTGRYRSYST